MTTTEDARKSLIARLFPAGIAPLWCPPLTHYWKDGDIDYKRMDAHLKVLSGNINSFLLPGSTGDGWEFTFVEFKDLLTFLFTDFDMEREYNVLVGLLRPDHDEAMQAMDYVITYLEGLDYKIAAEDYKMNRFKGFVICPPKGKDLSQEEIQTSMERFLKRGYPIVIYQLPQITENEMSPETVSYFANTYPNVYMMKDSSGVDNVAKAVKDYSNLQLVRGAEGDYSKHLKQNGGLYDGFLLSTGNTFPEQLSAVISHIDKGEIQAADEISARISKSIGGAFGLVGDLPFGNAFTNSNKLIDHIMAYGRNWLNSPYPQTHSGNSFPAEMLGKMEEILRENLLFPEKGYLED